MKLLYLLAALDLSPLPQPSGVSDGSVVRTLFNIFLAIMGAVGLLIITIAGLRLTISQGNPETVSKAKNTIIYTLAGLVIIAFAAVIVNFVLNRV